MAWARVDDAWWSHPKVIGLDMAARGLWITALSWACHQRKSMVPDRLVAMVGASERDADALANAGLWEPVEGGWEILGWSEYQDSTLREKRAEAGRKGGKASGATRRSKSADSDGLTSGNAEAIGEQTKQCFEANAEAGPSHPFPTLPNPSSSSFADQHRAVLEAVADRRTDEAKKAGRVRSSAVGFRAKTLANLPTEIGARVTSLCATYDEPARVLAEVVEGARDTRYLTRRITATDNHAAGADRGAVVAEAHDGVTA